MERRSPTRRDSANATSDKRAGSETGAPMRVKTATLICFEDVFPHLAREYADRDTDFLVNLTNDGWFGESAEQWQHAAGAVFRAIENGVALARCCNNGITCWVDSHGRIRRVFRDAAGGVRRIVVAEAESNAAWPPEVFGRERWPRRSQFPAERRGRL